MSAPGSAAGDRTEKERALETHSRQAPEFESSYGALAADPHGSCFAYSRHRLEGWLDRALPAGARLRLLDVGCGTGHHLARLKARGYEAFGVDGSAEMLERASARARGALGRADVEALPFRTASFDRLLCVEVLRYLPHPGACLREMARVLRPGGICLATATPRFNLNGYWLVNRLAARVGVANLVRLRQYFSTAGGLRRAFADAGFVDVEVHGVYFGPINWVERLAPAALAGALRRWEPIDARIADRPLVREMSNMFLVRAARREGP